MTELHKFLMYSCVELLKKSRAFINRFPDVEKSVSIVAVSDLKIDNTLPDVYTPLFNIECETGFKHKYDDLKGRLLLSDKAVIVVFPNDEVKVRYVRGLADIHKRKIRYCTLADFSHTVYDLLRSIDR
jgi:hypothetical protein